MLSQQGGLSSGFLPTALQNGIHNTCTTDLLESCRMMVEFLEMGLSRQRRSQPEALYWTGAVPWLWFRMNVGPRDPFRSRLSSAVREKDTQHYTCMKVLRMLLRNTNLICETSLLHTFLFCVCMCARATNRVRISSSFCRCTYV